MTKQKNIPLILLTILAALGVWSYIDAYDRSV